MNEEQRVYVLRCKHDSWTIVVLYGEEVDIPATDDCGWRGRVWAASRPGYRPGGEWTLYRNGWESVPPPWAEDESV